jgi:hypothetical protein
MSNKACAENSRQAGGNQAAMIDAMESFESGTKSDWDKRYTKLEWAYDRNTSLRSQEMHSMYTHHGRTITVYSYIGDALSRNKRERVLDMLTKDDIVNTKEAHVCFVADPGKWRPITKANWIYGRLKPYQKAIHGHLRKFDQFRLIGKTIEDVDVELFGKMDLAKESILSGDFEAATDNLHHDASVMTLGWILQNMRSSWSFDMEAHFLAKESMTHLNISYGEKLQSEQMKLPGMEGVNKLMDFEQKGGQLMGSLLSFPILCVINYAMWCEYKARATGLYPKATVNNSWTKDEFVLINGDDIGGVILDGTEKVWQKCVRSVGLTPSMGKNYVSKRFLTLNSQLYTFPNGVPVHEPWVNLALLAPLGSTKQTKDDREKKLEGDSDPLESLGKMHNDFIALCPKPSRGSSVFIKAHSKELLRTWRNLFGPRHLGGLGATPVPGEKGSLADGYHRKQLILARILKAGEVRLPGRQSSSSVNLLAQRLSTIRYSHAEMTLVSTDPETGEFLVPDGAEDISSLVDDLCQRFRAMLSWTMKLNLEPAKGTDHSWAHKVLKAYEGKQVFPYEVQKYLLEAPSEYRYLVMTDSKVASALTGETSVEHYLLDRLAVDERDRQEQEGVEDFLASL